MRLATLLRRIATCCELKIELVHMPRRNIVARTWPNGYNIMQHRQLLSPGQTIETFQRNISQHRWAQHVARAWPPCCDTLCIENQTSAHARAQH